MDAIDTNILVYAFDLAYPEKREVCKKIVQDIFSGKKRGVVTNQILAEFSFAVTNKIEKPLLKKDAAAIVGSILSSNNWDVLNYDGNNVLNALKAPEPFWDALITHTVKGHADRIITENVKDFGKSFEAYNPFSGK